VNFLSLGSSFVLGALDGFSPAHGKSLIAAFAVDERLRRRQLVAFTVAMLGSHFLLLAGIAVALRSLVAEHLSLAWLEWIGPLATIGFGAWLLWRRQRQVRAARRAGHDDDCRCARHDPDAGRPDAGLRQALTMGLLVGLMPCPMAISTVLIALQAGTFWGAAGIVGGYVLGMGLVLGAIAALVWWGRQRLLRARWLRGADATLRRLDTRLVSAWLILALGAVYLLTVALHGGHAHGL
jgi:nickel/cobalt exporter